VSSVDVVPNDNLVNSKKPKAKNQSMANIDRWQKSIDHKNWSIARIDCLN